MIDEYERAKALVLEHQKASTSWLQRQLRIGYNAAARHIEALEREGFVSAPDHIGRRTVLRPPSAALEGSSVAPEPSPWNRNEGKLDTPSSGLPRAGVHATRKAKGWTPPAAVPADPAPLSGLAVADRPIEDIAADLVAAIGIDGARKLVRSAAEVKGELDPPKVATPAEDWLKRIIERALALYDERRRVAADIRDLFGFAKEIGFNKSALRQVLKDIEADKDKRFEIEANVEIYRALLGIEGPDFVIELPAPAPPAGTVKKLTARDKQYREALALSAAATIDQ